MKAAEATMEIVENINPKTGEKTYRYRVSFPHWTNQGSFGLSCSIHPTLEEAMEHALRDIKHHCRTNKTRLVLDEEDNF